MRREEAQRDRQKTKKDKDTRKETATGESRRAAPEVEVGEDSHVSQLQHTAFQAQAALKQGQKDRGVR